MRQSASVHGRSSCPPFHWESARIFLPDNIIDISKFRQLTLDRVVDDWESRHFHDATFNRVKQPEIGNDPRKQLSFAVTRAPEKERRSRQIVNSLNADCRDKSLNATDPNSRSFLVLLRFFAIVSGKILLVTANLMTITMVRLVV